MTKMIFVTSGALMMGALFLGASTKASLAYKDTCGAALGRQCKTGDCLHGDRLLPNGTWNRDKSCDLVINRNTNQRK